MFTFKCCTDQIDFNFKILDFNFKILDFNFKCLHLNAVLEL